MKCIVSWIPSNSHVRSNKTQPCLNRVFAIRLVIRLGLLNPKKKKKLTCWCQVPCQCWCSCRCQCPWSRCQSRCQSRCRFSCRFPPTHFPRLLRSPSEIWQSHDCAHGKWRGLMTRWFVPSFFQVFFEIGRLQMSNLKSDVWAPPLFSPLFWDWTSFYWHPGDVQSDIGRLLWWDVRFEI